MGRSRDDDNSSVLTIQLDGKVDGKKSKRSVDSTLSSDLSDAKLQQLADAREKSIQSRRMTMKSKLERKLEDEPMRVCTAGDSEDDRDGIHKKIGELGAYIVRELRGNGRLDQQSGKENRSSSSRSSRT